MNPKHIPSPPVTDRRRFLSSIAACGAGGGLLGLSGCGDPKEAASAGAGDKPFAGQTLRVFVYSGAWEKGFTDHFVPLFEERTGARVVVDPGWWDSIPKLKASPPGQPAFDLVLTDATQGYPAIREGMFQTLDFSKIPNKANIQTSALDNWVVEEGYGITFPEAAMTLGYHKGLCPAPPTGWGDLLLEDYDGALGLYNSFYMSLYTLACMKVAQEGRPGTAAETMATDLQGVIDFAKSQRERVRLWWPTSTDMSMNLARRNVALGNMHSTDMLLALRDHPDLGAVVPESDPAYVLLMWVVSADSQVPDLAHAAIDLLFSAEVQRGFARTGQATTLAGVAAEVAAEDEEWAAFYPSTPEAIAAVRYYPYDVYMEHWDELVEVWDREVLRESV